MPIGWVGHWDNKGTHNSKGHPISVILNKKQKDAAIHLKQTFFLNVNLLLSESYNYKKLNER